MKKLFLILLLLWPLTSTAQYGHVSLDLTADQTFTGNITFTLLVKFSVDDATNTGVTDVAQFEHTTSGAPGAGIGTGVTWFVEDAGGSELQGRINVELDVVTDGAEEATMTFDVNVAGTMT